MEIQPWRRESRQRARHCNRRGAHWCRGSGPRWWFGIGELPKQVQRRSGKGSGWKGFQWFVFTLEYPIRNVNSNNLSCSPMQFNGRKIKRANDNFYQNQLFCAILNLRSKLSWFQPVKSSVKWYSCKTYWALYSWTNARTPNLRGWDWPSLTYVWFDVSSS